VIPRATRELIDRDEGEARLPDEVEDYRVEPLGRVADAAAALL